MEKGNKEMLDNELLIRLDDELNQTIRAHGKENDMTLSAIIRRSLRQFFQREGLKTVKPVKKQSQKNEGRD